MKTSKILTIVFAVLAIALYTMAVINFTHGDTLDGISNLLFAVTDSLMAYVMTRIERQREALARITDVLINAFKKLKDGLDVEVVIHDEDDETSDTADTGNVNLDSGE